MKVRALIRRFFANSMLLLRISAVLTLLALAAMVYSMIDPTVWPVMVAMSLAQGVGMMAFGLYLFVVIQDFRRVRRERRSGPLPLIPSGPLPVIDEDKRA